MVSLLRFGGSTKPVAGQTSGYKAPKVRNPNRDGSSVPVDASDDPSVSTCSQNAHL